MFAGREEQRHGGLCAEPARRRQEPGRGRPPADPSEDRRGRRRAPQDAGGEETLRWNQAAPPEPP